MLIIARILQRDEEASVMIAQLLFGAGTGATRNCDVRNSISSPFGLVLRRNQEE
jgi:hypothetical protein